MKFTITLALSDAPVDVLRRELADANRRASRCDQQGLGLHTWHERADAIHSELERREAQK